MTNAKIKLKKTSKENSTVESTTSLNTMSPQKFKIASIIICLIGDWIIALSVLVPLYQGKESFLQLFQTIASQQGVSIEDVDPLMIEEFYKLALNVSSALIGAALLFHILCYWLFFKDRSFGRGYVKSLAWLGTIGFLLFALTSLSAPIFALILFIQMFLYIFIIKGFKKLPIKE